MTKPEHITTIFILFIIVISSLVIRSYDIDRIRQLEQQTETQKMLGLSEFSATLIHRQWRTEANSADKIVRALQDHPQVSGAYLTNELAGVLSPKSRALEIVDDQNIEKLLNNDKINVLTIIEDSQLNIYRRINIADDEKAILVINKLLISNTISYFSLGFVLRLLVLAIIGVLVSLLLSRIWLKPWKMLYKDFEEALQTGHSPAISKSKTELVELHSLLYRRYLMKINNKRG